jgi:hypothetical protein
MATSSSKRVSKYRESMKAKGYRQVQMWVLDTRAPGFAEEAARQSRLAAEADKRDPELQEWLDAVLADMDLPPP